LRDSCPSQQRRIRPIPGLISLRENRRYLAASATLGPWLSERLGPRGATGRTPLPWVRFSESLDHVAAEIAALALRNRETVPANRG
jgi:hypothetical protein